MNKAWIYVILTCICELLWLVGFNVASVWWHWIPIVFLIAVDFNFLAKACAGLPTGTVYAIFAGVGSVGSVIIDTLFFGKTLSFGMVFFMVILVAGIIGLKLGDKQAKEAI